MEEKRYKEPIKEELETTINVLYNENKLVIYTNKVKKVNQPIERMKKKLWKKSD